MSHRLLPFRAPLELWGGIECTCNRVQEEYFDQFHWSGHYDRPDDLDAIADLGIATMRYPVLWERVAPEHPDEQDWSFSDARLCQLQQLNITPIAGLVHHGSGPRYTSLLDLEFPEKLAAYARSVAARYPWLELYTPVNEPLTTARFSGLYGHWFPHGQDDGMFVRALLNQCRGVALAMEEIRKINPRAKLVQTEDMCRVFSTRKLAYQAEFENERRWLSFDLLCGKVDSHHSMASYFESSGVEEREYSRLQESPCPPDVVGVNYYLTSERFLDERLQRYPVQEHGGNGRERYADVAAVRVCSGGVAGAASMLAEAWKRYSLPLAITEAHLGCTREEQGRWLWELWNQAHQARRSGADVRAVAVWSLLGAYNWNTLVTRCEGHYEPGVFDLSGGVRRPTFLAQLVQHLTSGRRAEHPVLAVPGWWRQPSRLLYPATTPHQAKRLESVQHRDLSRSGRMQSTRKPVSQNGTARKAVKPLVITGATGTLGNGFARLCAVRHLPYQLSSRRQMDIANRASVAAYLEKHHPWAVINTAGYVRVDDAETDAAACLRENTLGAAVLADECKKRNIAFVTFSSDLVFDGKQQVPYLESSDTNPLNAYGQSKADAEGQVLHIHPEAVVIRTSAFFGPWDEHNFVTMALRVLCDGRDFVAANDYLISPTYVPDLVGLSLDLLIDGASGIWHVANRGEVSWHQFAEMMAHMAKVDRHLVVGRPTAEMEWQAARPSYSVLDSERGAQLPHLEDALHRYFGDRAKHLESMAGEFAAGAGVRAANDRR